MATKQNCRTDYIPTAKYYVVEKIMFMYVIVTEMFSKLFSTNCNEYVGDYRTVVNVLFLCFLYLHSA